MSTDPLAPFRASASPEQRAACLHPPDDRVPISGDGWLCGLCGADCAPPEKASEELTGERLDEVEKLARYAHSTAFRTGKVLAAAVLALSAEVRRLREENARMRPVVEAAKAWSEDGTLAGEVALSKALGIWEPPRAEEDRKDG